MGSEARVFRAHEVESDAQTLNSNMQGVRSALAFTCFHPWNGFRSALKACCSSGFGFGVPKLTQDPNPEPQTLNPQTHINLPLLRVLKFP